MSILGSPTVPVKASRNEPARVTLPEWVERQAALYVAQGTPLATWLAGKLRQLASDVKFTEAKTPLDHEERMEALNEAYLERVWQGRLINSN